MCDYKYAEEGHLMRHMRMRHGITSNVIKDTIQKKTSKIQGENREKDQEYKKPLSLRLSVVTKKGLFTNIYCLKKFILE